MRCNTDLTTWLHDFADTDMFDVYYADSYKAVHNNTQESTHAVMINAIIEDIIELPNKEILIGFKDTEYDRIEYFRLKEIHLIRFEHKEETENDRTY